MMVMDMSSWKEDSCLHIMLLNFNHQWLLSKFQKLKDLGRGQTVACMCNYCLVEVQWYICFLRDNNNALDQLIFKIPILIRTSSNRLIYGVRMERFFNFQCHQNRRSLSWFLPVRNTTKLVWVNFSMLILSHFILNT